MSFLRTVLGDIPPGALGLCLAHEHIIIGPSFATWRFPEFALDDEDKAVAELATVRAAGGGAMIDSMPCAAGRDALKLAAVSRRSGVHIIAPTGLHLAKYYEPGHWSFRLGEQALASLFTADIQEGIDRHDYRGPVVERTPHRAGVIKVAGGRGHLSDHERRCFRAAAAAHLQTGAPILTHTEEGTAAMEQAVLLRGAGADPAHVVLSHTDRQPDAGLHRALLETGVRLEYDSAFRWTSGNPTFDLLERLYPDFPGQLLLGMDAARPSYWASYGGRPGLAWLLTTCRAEISRRLGAEAFDRILRANPASAYAFAPNSRQ